MLLQFTVENFRSIREPVTLNMLAADHVEHPEGSVYEVEGVGKVLKVAAIYGANASGKSNLVEAWFALCELVARGTGVDSPIRAHQPFKLDDQHLAEPTTFTAVFRNLDRTFRYTITVTASLVRQE